MYEIFKANESNKLPLNFDAWKLGGDRKIEFVKLKLKSGEHIESHINNVDVYFFIISGEAKYIIEEKSEILQEGEILYIPKNLTRELKNISKNDLVVLVIKIIG